MMPNMTRVPILSSSFCCQQVCEAGHNKFVSVYLTQYSVIISVLSFSVSFVPYEAFMLQSVLDNKNVFFLLQHQNFP